MKATQCITSERCQCLLNAANIKHYDSLFLVFLMAGVFFRDEKEQKKKIRAELRVVHDDVI